MSTLNILNVGTGDTKLTFDKDKPAERERAAKVVTEMLERGYAILVQVGEQDGEPLYRRAKGFDPTTCEYLIVGLPEDEQAPVQKEETIGASLPSAPRRKRGRPRRVDASKAPAVAVARSAGGCARKAW